MSLTTSIGALTARGPRELRLAPTRTANRRRLQPNPAMTMRVYAHVVEGADEAVAVTLGQALDGNLA